MNGKRIITILISISFFYLIFSPTYLNGHAPVQRCSDNPPPEMGDWIVNETTVIKNRTIILTGNLTVTGTGYLILDNVTLYMNLSEDGQYGIKVDGGRLDLLNGTLISSLNSTYRYDMEFTTTGSGGRGLLRDSTIEYCGYAGGTYGPWIRTNGVRIINMTFRHNFRGLQISDSSRDVVNSRFIENDDIGLYLYHYTGTVFNCTFIRNGNTSSPSPLGIGDEGICSWYSSPSILNNTFVENIGEADATANLLIVDRSGENITVRNNTFSKGERGIAVIKSNVLIENNKVLDMNESGIALGTSGSFPGDENVWVYHNYFRGNMVGIAISKADDTGGDWSTAYIENNTFVNDDGAVAVYGPNDTWMNVTYLKVVNNTINDSGGGIIFLWGWPKTMEIFNNTGSGVRVGMAFNHSFAVIHSNNIEGGNLSYQLPSWVEDLIGSASGDIWVDNFSVVHSYDDVLHSGNISGNSTFYRFGDISVYGGWNITNSTMYISGNMSIYGLLNSTNSSIYFSANGTTSMQIYGAGKVINSTISSTNNSYYIRYAAGSSGKIENSEISHCGYPGSEGLYVLTENITIKRSVFSNGLQALMGENSSFIVENTTFLNSTEYDVMALENSTITLLNCSFNGSLLGISNGSIEVQWFMHVKVMDSNGKEVPYANITIEDNSNGTSSLTRVSDENGTSMWNVVTEYILNSTGKTLYTPHLVSAEKNGWRATTEAFMNITKWVYVTIDVLSPPTNLSAYVNGTDITLRWTDSNSSTVDHYNIYRSTEKGSLGTLIATVNPGVQQWSDTNVVGDGTDYFYTIRAADSNDNEDSNMEQLQKHDQHLSEGLNLISPVLFSSAELTSYNILNGQPNGIPGCTNVQRWNTSSNSWEQAYLLLGSPRGKNFPILPGYGYFVKVDADTTWTTAGKAILSPLTLNLTQGLNLIGIPYSSSNLTSYDLLDGQPNGIPGCTNVQRWNTSSNSWEQAYLLLGSPRGKNFPILPGYGYFVKVDADTTWSPQSSNPGPSLYAIGTDIQEDSKAKGAVNPYGSVQKVSVYELTLFADVRASTEPLKIPELEHRLEVKGNFS